MSLSAWVTVVLALLDYRLILFYETCFLGMMVAVLTASRVVFDSVSRFRRTMR